jgi:hypothetical protein
LAAPSGFGQKSGLAFWEPDAKHVDPVLQVNPKTTALRYSVLRHSFVDFGCTPGLLEEQAAGKHGEKNLVCTLPGKTPETILILSRYDAQGKTQPAWDAALMLPLAYHALQAQPRQFTFIFAVLDGYNGEKAFFSWLHAAGRQPPTATIVLDSLGMGLIRLAEPRGKHQGKDSDYRAIQQRMGDEAAKTAQLMNIPDPSAMHVIPYNDPMGLGQQSQRIVQSTLVDNALESPSAVLYSEAGTPVSAAAFHEQFDFVAWFLCAIDAKLAATTASTPH